jgi:hypothetical protein
MAFLMVAGLVVSVAEGGASKLPPETVGSSGRAFAGNLRSTVRAEKRGWQVRTGLLTLAEASAIEDAVALRVQIACAGDLLRASANLLGTDALPTHTQPGALQGGFYYGYGYGATGALTLNAIGLRAGDPIAGSFETTAHAGGGDMWAEIVQYDAGGAVCATADGSVVPAISVGGTARATVATTVASNAARVALFVVSHTAGDVASTRAMLNRGSTALPYAKGTDPITCEVAVGEGAYINTTTDDGTGALRSLVLTLREV